MANKRRGYYTLKIEGKDRILHFSMLFWEVFTDKLGIQLDGLDKIFGKTLDLKTLRLMIFAGAKAYDLENGVDVDYTEYTVAKWLEEIDAEELTSIVSALTESRILGNDLNGGIRRNVTETTKTKKKQKPA